MSFSKTLFESHSVERILSFVVIVYTLFWVGPAAGPGVDLECWGGRLVSICYVE